MWQWLVAARVASNYKSFIINKYEYRNKWFIIPVFFCVAAEFVCLNVGRLQYDGACDPFNTKCKRVFIMSNFDWSPIIHILLLCSRFGKMPSHMVFVASQIDMFLGIFSISTVINNRWKFVDCWRGWMPYRICDNNSFTIYLFFRWNAKHSQLDGHFWYIKLWYLHWVFGYS